VGNSEFRVLGKEITAILDRQGERATVISVRAELVERSPSVEVLANAFGTHSVIETMRSLDKLIAERIEDRPRDDLGREMTRRGAVWLTEPGRFGATGGRMTEDVRKTDALAERAIRAIVSETRDMDDRRAAAKRVAEHFGLRVVDPSDYLIEAMKLAVNTPGILRTSLNPVVKQTTVSDRWGGPWEIREFADGSFDVAAQAFHTMSPPLPSFEEAQDWISGTLEPWMESELGD
jgi:hypothetical protein